MRRVHLSSRASDDIVALTRHGIQHFGVEQAALYYDELFKQFELLAEHPNIGRPVGCVERDLKKFGFGAHVIVYEASKNKILIRRILHNRMDLWRHL